MNRREALAGWGFAAPALSLLACFMILPFGAALVWSFTDYRLGSPLSVSWVGLQAYGRAWSDPAFQHAVLNNACFAAMVVPVQTALALLVALFLQDRWPGIGLVRSLFVMPVVYPMALVAVVWLLLYSPGPQGQVNALVEVLSFGAWRADNDQGLLTEPRTALPAIALLSIWQGLGFQLVILLAGLQDVPRALHEAAALDGAGPWQRFRQVTLPALRGPLTFTVLVTAILAFRLFDQVRIMTQGGPEYATTTMMYEAYRAGHQRGAVGQAAAMSVILFVIVCSLTLLPRLWRRPRAVAA